MYNCLDLYSCLSTLSLFMHYNAKHVLLFMDYNAKHVLLLMHYNAKHVQLFRFVQLFKHIIAVYAL
jgi:hypothetical protein